MTFRSGDFVAYGGRAGRIAGVESVIAAGARLDTFVVALTATPGAVIRLPVDQAADKLQRISAAQAAMLDANPVAPIIGRQSKLQRAKQDAAKKERLAEMGRLSGLARARKRQA
jgi:hypothetical protein